MKDFMDSFLNNVDSLFLINMGALIILMQAEFGFLEADAVRAKNTHMEFSYQTLLRPWSSKPKIVILDFLFRLFF